MKIEGWVLRKRKTKNAIFVDIHPLNETYKVIQYVARREESEEVYNKAKSVKQQNFIEIDYVKEDKDNVIKDINLISGNLDLYPIGKKEHGPEFLLQNRHLAIRGYRYPKIFYIQSQITKYATQWFQENEWNWVHPPILISSATEGGAKLFEVNWYGERKVFLSESAQLYLEALIYSLGKVFSLTTSFRAEKSRTPRHLSEYRHLEAEAPMYKFEDILDTQEKLVKYVLRKLMENEETRGIIEEFRKEDIKYIKNAIEKPFIRLPYDKAIELLNENNVKIEWGEDLGYDEERTLTKMFELPIFLMYYPTKERSFYVKKKEGREEVCLSADLLLPEGYGEVTTSGQREDDYEKLKEEIRKRGYKVEDYNWYLDLRKYGSVPHSGFGLGIERFTMWVLRLDHIRDAVPFPRMYRVKELWI